MVKSALRKLVPEPVLRAYHLALAGLAAVWYGHPSDQMTVIGVTGTNGKSTTVQYIGRLLEHAGFTVGWTSTAGFKIANKEWENDQKMTMLGRFQTQKMLREMVRAGCTHAIVETSSQGVAQFRHIGINYDIGVFTNLTPEHIEAHGGFEKYKQAKGAFFAHLGNSDIKRLRQQATGAQPPLTPPSEGGELVSIPKTIVVNIDDKHAAYFLGFAAERYYGYGLEGKSSANKFKQSFINVSAEKVKLSSQGSTFVVEDQLFELAPIGRFNVYNALAAIATARALGLAWSTIAAGVEMLTPVPGRLESIDEGQSFGVIVDYAYEPAALQACFDAVALLAPTRIIHVLGSAGGGRDVARRFVLGKMAGAHSDMVIITNEDPYDDDPQTIIDQVAAGAIKAGKREGIDLFRILDRQIAIDQAVALAKPGDLVLITGKGCEPVMAVAHGKKIPWDDRIAARLSLKRAAAL